MAGLCEGGNEPSGSLKAIRRKIRSGAGDRNRVLGSTYLESGHKEKNTGGEGFDPVLWIELRRRSMVRALVKRILCSNWAEQPPVRTPEELWDRVLDAREEMAKNLDLFYNLVDSMPRRMRAVVDAGGETAKIRAFCFLGANVLNVSHHSQSMQHHHRRGGKENKYRFSFVHIHVTTNA
ncbi:hypothetical protein ANN_08580 [Periplaneta americana]|uniref:Uncharacterized protein n=1 Tax=Periplaneta americana TaxID=6978 RepID=A0ABQ8T1T3_PERAM|nr:hypothetical protein ANN_08580 [Periplaneta americana]